MPKESRRPRTPRAGFSSPSSVAKATGLSDPASSVRTTTVRSFPNADEHGRVEGRLLLDRRFLLAVEEAQLGAEEPAALDRPLGCVAGRDPVGDVGEHLHRGSVGRARRPGPRLEHSPLLDGLRHPATGVRGVRTDLDLPGHPVHEHLGAAVETHGTVHRDDAGDAELARDDRGVAGRATTLGDQRQHQLRIETGRVGGREILRDQDARDVRGGHPGLGLADDLGGQPPLEVAQVGDPLGHQPTHRAEQLGELVDAGAQCAEEVVAALDTADDRRPESLVAGEPGGGGEHLGGGSAGGRGPVGQPTGHRRDGRVVAGEGFLVGRSGGAVRRDRLGGDLGADHHHRPERGAGHDGRAGEEGGVNVV